MIIKRNCVECNTHCTLEVDSGDYQEWLDGKLIQNAFPYLSAGDREMLITGICDVCWENMFSLEPQS